MSYRFARFLSIVLHPALMPAYAIFLIFQLSSYLNYTTPYSVKLVLFTVVVFNTFIMPVFIVYLLLKRGYIKSFNMEERNERSVPFVVQAILMMITYYMLLRLELPRIFYLMLLGAAISVLIVVLINLKWKISIHMVGIGGIAGMLLGLSTLLFLDLRMPVIISILFAGILGTARLRMGAHRPAQIYVGYLVGFVCEYFILAI